MKGKDIFCASQAATAVRLGMDEGSSSYSSFSSLSAIDRHNPIIREARRIDRPLPPPSFSQPPITTPKPHKHHDKSRNNCSKPSDSTRVRFSTKENDEKRQINTCAETSDGHILKKSWSCTKPGDFISPLASSSRQLLSDATFLDKLSDSDPALKLVPVESSNPQAVKTEEPSVSKPPEQVAVLRVSLHCKGCERKMRKHVSRMEGVTSFNIDFAAKKVTVIGDVTPLGVLASVSKVKNAQLWTPPISSSFPTVASDLSEFKKCM